MSISETIFRQLLKLRTCSLFAMLECLACNMLSIDFASRGPSPTDELSVSRGCRILRPATSCSTEFEEGKDVADTPLTCIEVTIWSKLDKKLRLRDPVEDREQVVWGFDIERDWVRCSQILGVNDLELVQAKFDRRIDTVDKIEGERTAHVISISNLSLDLQPIW